MKPADYYSEVNVVIPSRPVLPKLKSTSPTLGEMDDFRKKREQYDVDNAVYHEKMKEYRKAKDDLYREFISDLAKTYEMSEADINRLVCYMEEAGIIEHCRHFSSVMDEIDDLIDLINSFSK